MLEISILKVVETSRVSSTFHESSAGLPLPQPGLLPWRPTKFLRRWPARHALFPVQERRAFEGWLGGSSPLAQFFSGNPWLFQMFQCCWEASWFMIFFLPLVIKPGRKSPEVSGGVVLGKSTRNGRLKMDHNIHTPWSLRIPFFTSRMEGRCGSWGPNPCAQRYLACKTWCWDVFSVQRTLIFRDWLCVCIPSEYR